MPVIKEISTLLGLLIFFTPVLPVIAAQGQPIKTKSFTEWCQNKMSVSVETRKTINLLLKKAEINDCQIANSKLGKLTSLDLRYNQISDIKPLAALTNLTSLSLALNQISDVKPLVALTNLTVLSLALNQISDVKPLVALTNLTVLSLALNQISDVKELAALTNLTALDLRSNKIIEKICPMKPQLICQF
jgi:internalin A